MKHLVQALYYWLAATSSEAPFGKNVISCSGNTIQLDTESAAIAAATATNNNNDNNNSILQVGQIFIQVDPDPNTVCSDECSVLFREIVEELGNGRYSTRLATFEQVFPEETYDSSYAQTEIESILPDVCSSSSSSSSSLEQQEEDTTPTMMSRNRRRYLQNETADARKHDEKDKDDDHYDDDYYPEKKTRFEQFWDATSEFIYNIYCVIRNLDCQPYDSEISDDKYAFPDDPDDFDRVRRASRRTSRQRRQLRGVGRRSLQMSADPDAVGSTSSTSTSTTVSSSGYTTMEPLSTVAPMSSTVSPISPTVSPMSDYERPGAEGEAPEITITSSGLPEITITSNGGSEVSTNTEDHKDYDDDDEKKGDNKDKDEDDDHPTDDFFDDDDSFTDNTGNFWDLLDAVFGYVEDLVCIFKECDHEVPYDDYYYDDHDKDKDKHMMARKLMVFDDPATLIAESTSWLASLLYEVAASKKDDVSSPQVNGCGFEGQYLVGDSCRASMNDWFALPSTVDGQDTTYTWQLDAACYQQDYCYASSTLEQTTCDEQFYKKLMQACSETASGGNFVDQLTLANGAALSTVDLYEHCPLISILLYSKQYQNSQATYALSQEKQIFYEDSNHCN